MIMLKGKSLIALVVVYMALIATVASAQDYAYDALNRLTMASYPDGTVITYTYDATGNRTSQVVTKRDHLPQPPMAKSVPVKEVRDYDYLTLKIGTNFDHAQQEVTPTSERGGGGPILGSHEATLRGLEAEYRFNNKWLMSGRFLAGAISHDSQGGYEKFEGTDRDVAVRLEYRMTEEGWIHFGYAQMSSSTDGSYSQPVYGPPVFRVVDNQLVSMSPVIGTVIQQIKEKTSFEGLEVGFEGRGHYKRIVYQAGAEFYPRTTVTGEVTSIYGKEEPQTSGTGGHAIGMRFAGSAGVMLYKGFGVEANMRSVEFFGPDNNDAKRFNAAIALGVAAVVKF